MAASFINCTHCRAQVTPRGDGNCPTCGNAVRVPITVDEWTDFPDVCAACGRVGRRRVEVVAARDKDGPIEKGEYEKRSLRAIVTQGLLPMLFDAAKRQERLVAVELPVCVDCVRTVEFRAEFSDFERGELGVFVHANLKAALAQRDPGRASS